MKLYDIPRHSKLKIGDDIIVFDHLDGMYSYCYFDGEPEKICHISAVTPLKKVGEYYEIDESQEVPKYAKPLVKHEPELSTGQ